MFCTSNTLLQEGAREMLPVDEVDDKNFLAGLFNTMYEELTEPKKKK